MGLLDPTLLTNLNKLKGLLGETPIGRYVQGKDQGVSVNGLKQALLGMPVFDQRAGQQDMAYAMDAMGPQVMGLAGAIIPGGGWAGKRLPSVEKLAKNHKKFLYHSGTADAVGDMKYGLEPTNQGEWVKEVAGGAVDNVDEFLESATPLAWLSDAPEWVGMKAARASGKSLDQLSLDDIKKAGHLAVINKKDPSLKNAYRVGDEGLSNGPYSIVENARGKKMKAYETPLYGEGNYGNKIEPFGVERNEWVSTDSVDPLVHLTGDDLIEFLRRSGYLKSNLPRGILGGK